MQCIKNVGIFLKPTKTLEKTSTLGPWLKITAPDLRVVIVATVIFVEYRKKDIGAFTRMVLLKKTLLHALFTIPNSLLKRPNWNKQ